MGWFNNGKSSTSHLKHLKIKSFSNPNHSAKPDIHIHHTVLPNYLLTAYLLLINVALNKSFLNIYNINVVMSATIK